MEALVALSLRSEEHTSELQSPCISYAVFFLKKEMRITIRAVTRLSCTPGHIPCAVVCFTRIRRTPRSTLCPDTALFLLLYISLFFIKRQKTKSFPPPSPQRACVF